MIIDRENKPLLGTQWVDYVDGVRFQLRGLTNFDLAERFAKDSYGGELGNHLSTYMLEKYTRASLVGWSGVKDEDGVPVDYDSKYISQLSPEAVKLIGYTAAAGSTLDGEAKKKSSSKPTSSGTRKNTTAKRAPKGTVVKRKKRPSKSSK